MLVLESWTQPWFSWKQNVQPRTYKEPPKDSVAVVIPEHLLVPSVFVFRCLCHFLSQCLFFFLCELLNPDWTALDCHNDSQCHMIIFNNSFG